MSRTRRVTITLSGGLLDQVERLHHQAIERTGRQYPWASTVRSLMLCGLTWLDEQHRRRVMRALIRGTIDDGDQGDAGDVV